MNSLKIPCELFTRNERALNNLRLKYFDYKVIYKKVKTKEDIKDFEEDVMGEKAPDTADAMKRYKVGKAGFTDKSHLKAKGLIPRADGTKQKSD